MRRFCWEEIVMVDVIDDVEGETDSKEPKMLMTSPEVCD